MQEDQLESLLLQKKLLTEPALRQAVLEARKSRISLDRYLLEKKLVDEKKFYAMLGDYWHLPVVDLETIALDPKVVKQVPENMARRHEVVLFSDDQGEAHLAMADPFDLETQDALAKKLGKKIVPYLASPVAISRIIGFYHHDSLDHAFGQIAKTETTSTKTFSPGPFIPPKQPHSAFASPSSHLASMVRIVDQILEEAVFQNASDIHFEPREQELAVRFRVDGVLRDFMTLPKTVQSALVARIKVLSRLKLDEHRLPQDGRFMIRNENYKVAFRVSIIPVYDGEKIVLRLLNESAKVLDLEQLGILSEPLTILRRNIAKPHGMILVTGPTGSGKTTTLYTVLSILNTVGVNILTIEDPIEYRIPRINQSQVQPKIGFSFANGLRSILRQDPDIIMVGEIRDNETAEIAVHAAMTGHLLLSTLHTNDAPSALPRLAEMGVPSFLVASTTNIIIAQRLVRRLCSACREAYVLSKDQIKGLEKQLDFKQVVQVMDTYGDFSSKELRFYRARGCKKCGGEGYQGRVGIYELLEVTRSIAELVLKGGSANELKLQATKEGMIFMLHDGFIKARKGITSIEEILRVSKE